MNRLKKALCLILPACLTAALAACTPQNQMGDPQPVPVNLSVPEQREREVKQGDVFVAPDGDDANPGTAEAPVRTPQRAVELARSLNKEEKVIFLVDGEYNVSAITLTQADSGITFYAENEAVFNGGLTLHAADFQPYEGDIRVLDLSGYGVTADRIGQVRAFGQYNTAEKYDASGSLYCELFCNGKRMTLSRYPNTGEYLYTGKIVDNGDSREVYTSAGTQTNAGWETMKFPRGGTFEAPADVIERVKSWAQSPDVWMFGYFQYDWADSTTPLASVGDNTITTEYASVYGFKEGAPYYFFNVFEELDQEGEWYIDRDGLKLYFIPPAGFEQQTVELSLETENLVTIDGAENVTFDGITFTGTRASAIKGSGNHITIRGCTIRNVGENAIELTGEHILAEDNEITATGKGGLILTGGDRQTLQSSGNVATNNLIHDWSQVYRTYQAAVSLNGVGGTCSHNEIYNSPHEAITYTGNNHIIEYNVIHDVVLESSDAGAIYAGRSWSSYGNVIRYNCIYNIGSGEFAPSGIYFDDALSGQQAYGNFLLNIPGCGFLLGGGRDLMIENNLIVNAGVPIQYDDRAIAGIEDGGWFTHANTPDSTLWKSLEEVDIHSEVWENAYPELAALSDDFENTDDPAFAANPAGSTVKSNVVVNRKKTMGDFARRVEQYSEVYNNFAYRLKANPFESAGIYQLTQPPEGFEQLPFGQMGRTATCSPERSS